MRATPAPSARRTSRSARKHDDGFAQRNRAERVRDRRDDRDGRLPEDDASASIRIAEAVGTISGTVTDAETNASLAEIDVVVKNGTEVVGTTITGSEGTYAIDVPATDLTVIASNATYAPADQTVALAGSGTPRPRTSRSRSGTAR